MLNLWPGRRCVTWIALALIASPALSRIDAAGGIIYYNATVNSGSPAQLRRINGDGTGAQTVATPFKEASFPVASRDGRRLLVTAPDPARPFKVTQNAYSIDLATGQILQATAYEDFVRTKAGEIIVKPDGALEHPDDPVVSAYTTHLANAKAYSPDGRRIAVMDLAATSGTLQNTDSTLQSFNASSPTLHLHELGQLSPVPILVQVGAERTGSNHGGEGTDWHPTLNEVVGAFRANIPISGNAGFSKNEGTIVVVFAADGRSQPFLRALTSPTGVWDTFFLPDFSFYSFIATENDYAPAISPDGTRVAYVRDTIQTDTRISLTQGPCHCSIHVINYDGSGDREILAFPDGTYVSKLCWSPDGTEIAFDAAPQLQAQTGDFYQLGDLSRSEIGAVRADGSSQRRIAGPPAAFPTWTVEPPSLPIGNPSVGIARAGQELVLQVGNLAAGRQIVVETSADLRAWNPAREVTATGTTQEIRLPITTTAKREFIRVRTR